MEKKDIDLKKQNLKSKIDNLTFHRNINAYLSGSYVLITASGIGELISNDFNLSEFYIPLLLGSVAIAVGSFKNAKENNYKLKKVRKELNILEQEETNKKI